MGNYKFEAVPVETADPNGQRLALSDRVRRGELFAFVEIGAEALHPAKETADLVSYYTNAGGIDQTQLWLTEPVNDGLRRVRLSQLGIDRDHSNDVIAAVPMTRMGLVSRSESTGAIQEARKGNAVEGIAVPFILLFLMMMIVMIGAAPMLAAVAEDKMQRVFEMLLASATPFELIMGKVIASVGRSLTSSVFYILGGILALQGMALLGVVPFRLLPWFFLYLIAEVTMLSAIGAALGAVCKRLGTPKIAPLMVAPVIIPLFLLVPLAQQPNSVFATIVSLIPPFTPLVMIMRQAMPGGVPAWQPWVGLAGRADLCGGHHVGRSTNLPSGDSAARQTPKTCRNAPLGRLACSTPRKANHEHLSPKGPRSGRRDPGAPENGGPRSRRRRRREKRLRKYRSRERSHPRHLARKFARFMVQRHLIRAARPAQDTHVHRRGDSDPGVRPGHEHSGLQRRKRRDASRLTLSRPRPAYLHVGRIPAAGSQPFQFGRDLGGSAPHRTTVSVANLVDYRAQSHAFSELAGDAITSMNLTNEGSPERIYGENVTANFLPTLGVQPAVGRGFLNEDDQLATTKS